MSLDLGTLYHWPPKDRRLSVLKSGLEIMAAPAVHSVPFPWICLGTTPSSAWGLTLAEQRQEVEVWDLWQVALRDTDHVEVLSNWGPVIREVRIHNGLPPDRVWWAGERDCHAGIALQRKQRRRRSGHKAGPQSCK